MQRDRDAREGGGGDERGEDEVEQLPVACAHRPRLPARARSAADRDARAGSRGERQPAAAPWPAPWRCDGHGAAAAAIAARRRPAPSLGASSSPARRRRGVRLATGGLRVARRRARTATTVMLSSPPARFAASTSASRDARRGRRRPPRRAARISLVAQHRGQPVGAEQVEVAGRGLDGERVDVDVGLGAERARDHGALRVAARPPPRSAGRCARARATSEWSAVSCSSSPSRRR